MSRARVSPARPGTTEKQWQAIVVRLATMLGWRCYHTHNSRRSDPGWPDLALCLPGVGKRPGRLILAELKTDRGKLRPAQRGWLEILGTVPGVETHIWRPGDLDEVARILRG